MALCVNRDIMTDSGASLVSRLRNRDWDWEQIGRALIEYGGVPLAFFMTAGIIVNVLRGYGMYHSFFDPLSNYHLYFVLNVWIVTMVYFYRQNYQPSLVFESRYEIGLAMFAGLTWLASLPVLLLIGYGFYLVAILRHDTLHGSFLPDIEETESGTDSESKNKAWGHIQNIKDHMG